LKRWPNLKYDISQLGRVLFEFAVGQRAFSYNFANLNLKEALLKLDIPLEDNEVFGEECQKNVSTCIHSMLQIEYMQRPTAPIGSVPNRNFPFSHISRPLSNYAAPMLCNLLSEMKGGWQRLSSSD
jgi:hypothetical protein